MRRNEHKPLMTELLLAREAADSDAVYLKQPRNGHWQLYTWTRVMDEARRVANFLIAQGLKRGDRLAIFSKNCAEWFIVDFGITLAGMVSVPLFSNQHETSIEFVLSHAEAKLVFIGKLDNHEETRGYIPKELQTVGFDYHSDLKVDYTWADMMSVEPLVDVVHPEKDALYTIIYSSGTSGNPKGAMYTHEAIANYLAIFSKDIRRISSQAHYILLSYLPLAHVYERSAILLGSLTLNCDVSFVESLEKFSQNLQTVKPTLFAAVPRIWGVFQNKIQQKISPNLLNILLKIPFVSAIIKNRIKNQLGLENSQANVCGAAHLPTPIQQFFKKLDMPILEGYGQSENLAYATLSLRENEKAGYVGTPRLGVEIKLADNNELLMTCPCLMLGYYKEEQATKNAFTEEGWLRTGDIAEIDSQNRVKIIARLSETFKNQKGEFITPTLIEKQFSEHNELIENLCLIGQGLASNVLLVRLCEEAYNMPRDEVADRLKKSLHNINPKLKSYEKVSHVLVVKNCWTVENEVLTPTLKIKRRVLAENNRDFIQKAIAKSDKVIWE